MNDTIRFILTKFPRPCKLEDIDDILYSIVENTLQKLLHKLFWEVR